VRNQVRQVVDGESADLMPIFAVTSANGEHFYFILLLLFT